MQHAVRILTFALAASLVVLPAGGCATFTPQPVDEAPLLAGAHSSTDGDVTVTVAVLSPDNEQRVFGGPGEEGRAPVWLRIENKSTAPCWFMPHRTDPEYFSALETANIAHVLLPAETNRRMDEHFSELQIKRCIPPGKARAGFVFTKRDIGLKPLVVMLVTPGAVKHFTFAVPVPGPELDLQKVDFDRLYGPGGITSLDERGLRLPGQNLHQHGSSATSARGNTPGRAIPRGRTPARPVRPTLLPAPRRPADRRAGPSPTVP
jgi:hypothetical protein